MGSLIDLVNEFQNTVLSTTINDESAFQVWYLKLIHSVSTWLKQHREADKRQSLWQTAPQHLGKCLTLTTRTTPDIHTMGSRQNKPSTLDKGAS